MKSYINIFLLICILFLASCSGSGLYRGKWKATDSDGHKLDITFEPKSFEIKDTTGKVVKYDYTQNSVKIENSIRTYGIHLGDGRAYTICFPVANDTGKAIIMLENNEPVYTMSRDSYIEYKDIYDLAR